MKGYAVSGITAGLTAGLYDKWVGTHTGASNTGAVSNNTGMLANSGKVAAEGGLSTWVVLASLPLTKRCKTSPRQA